MKVLAVDTSTMMSSISILENGKIIGNYSVNQEQTHSEMLITIIKRLLKDLKIELKEIDLFAVTKGPGSFTGLRIGMTSIKALAQVMDKPIVGVSTLEALAYSIINDSYIFSIMDARGKRYFAGLYKWENDSLNLIFEDLITEADIIDMVENYPKITFVGEAIAKLPDEIKNRKNVILSPSSLNNDIAKNASILALKKYINGHRDSYFDLKPNYLRKSQAEINLQKEGKNGKNI